MGDLVELIDPATAHVREIYERALQWRQCADNLLREWQSTTEQPTALLLEALAIEEQLNLETDFRFAGLLDEHTKENNGAALERFETTAGNIAALAEQIHRLASKGNIGHSPDDPECVVVSPYDPVA